MIVVRRVGCRQAFSASERSTNLIKRAAKSLISFKLALISGSGATGDLLTSRSSLGGLGAGLDGSRLDRCGPGESGSKGSGLAKSALIGYW